MAAVYVLSKAGKPLMATTRCGHVRHLLKQKKAKVVATKPFTIQLLYECPEEKQPLVLGIDPGRTNIGVAVVKEDGEPVFSAEVRTRNKEIPKLMTSRRAFRQAHRRLGRRKVRQRRAKKAGTVIPGGSIKRVLPVCEEPIECKLIRNKEARFNNRKRPAGWLTPTANQLLLTHLNVVKKIQKFIPLSDVVLELNKFAFMAIDNPNIRRWQYQKGSLHGFSSVEDVVFRLQEGHCIFCKKPIAHYHHIGTFAGLHWYYTETAEGRRAVIDQQSNINNGLERTINILNADGEVIRTYTGVIDIEGNDGGYVVFDYNGRCYTYYNCYLESIADIE